MPSFEHGGGVGVGVVLICYFRCYRYHTIIAEKNAPPVCYYLHSTGTCTKDMYLIANGPRTNSLHWFKSFFADGDKYPMN